MTTRRILCVFLRFFTLLVKDSHNGLKKWRYLAETVINEINLAFLGNIYLL